LYELVQVSHFSGQGKQVFKISTISVSLDSYNILEGFLQIPQVTGQHSNMFYYLMISKHQSFLCWQFTLFSYGNFLIKQESSSIQFDVNEYLPSLHKSQFVLDPEHVLHVASQS